MEPSKEIGKILRDMLVWVPPQHPIDQDDLGYLIVRAICKFNGSTLIDNKIYHGNMLIGDKMNYRFDGDYIKIAYMSLLQNKLITATMKVV